MLNDHQDYHNRARSSALTKAERETLRQRHLEAAEFRKAGDNHNLAAALRLGAALKHLKNEG